MTRMAKRKLSTKQLKALARGRALSRGSAKSKRKKVKTMAGQKKRGRRNKTHVVHGLTIAGAAISGYDYLLGGGAGVNALKSGNFTEYSRNIRATITENSISQHVMNNIPLIVGLAGQGVLGRKNPGVKLGKWSFKLF